MATDNDNRISKPLCPPVICEEVELPTIKSKESVVVVLLVDEGVSAVHKTKDSEG